MTINEYSPIGPFDLIQGMRASRHKVVREPITSLEEYREVVTRIERLWTCIKSDPYFLSMELEVCRVYDYQIAQMPKDYNFAQKGYLISNRTKYFRNKNQPYAQQSKFEEIFSYVENDLTKNEVDLEIALEVVRQGSATKDVLQALIKVSDEDKSFTDTMLEVNEDE